MGARAIITVGFELDSEDVSYTSFRSKTSLLDWDIIVFRPQVHRGRYARGDLYLGKPCLPDGLSFEFKECCEHWRREIKQAVEIGKTVIIPLPPLFEVYVATGEKSYSGTGRNRQTTRMVAQWNNYKAIPLNLDVVSTTGTSMRLSAQGSEVLASYWAEFGSLSTYQVIISGEGGTSVIVTKSGEKTVGLISQCGKGFILLLPNLELGDDDIEDGPTDRTFAKRFIKSIVELDKAMHSRSDVTPEPDWAGSDSYTLPAELDLRSQLLKAEKQAELAQKNKERIAENLDAAGRYRALLYEKGNRLELAIIESLRVLGFHADNYTEGTREFDVVFSCADGRLIGEAEGKDKNAVNVDKLRQLSMNIQEDLQRPEVAGPAKAVLFGNGFRLQPPETRENPFTDKCREAAKLQNTALVFAPDLFHIVKYLSHCPNDENYARACRTAILTGVGRVTFPAPPAMPTGEDFLNQESSDE